MKPGSVTGGVRCRRSTPASPRRGPPSCRRMLAFAGPAYLVSVGYMDPGNWATDLEGGARFGYQLLWVLVLSNLMAILLQTLAARLGIVAGRDLAQACRESYPRRSATRCGCCARSRSPPAIWPRCWARPSRCSLLFGLPLLIGRAADRARYDAGAVAVALRHPPDRGADPEPDRDHHRVLPGGAGVRQAGACTRCSPAWCRASTTRACTSRSAFWARP